VKAVDAQSNVTRIVEELKTEAAQRQNRVDTVALQGVALDDANGADSQILLTTFEPPESFDPAFEIPFINHNQLEYSLEDFLIYDDRHFIRHAYQAILKRPPDPDALVSGLEVLRNGQLDKIDLLLEITSSLEGHAKGVRVTGLRPHEIARTLCSLPLLRYLANPIYALFQWRSNARDQQRSRGLVLTRQENMAEFVLNSGRVLENALRVVDEQEHALRVLEHRLNALTTSSAESLEEEVARRQQQFKDRTKEIEELRFVYNKYRTQVELTEKDLKREMEHLFRKYQEVKTELVYQSQRLGSLEDGGSISSPPTATAKEPAAPRNRAYDSFFASFDEHFRGDRDAVKQRLRSYLPLIRESGAGTEAAPILDLACGRGEWLELLNDEKLQARGLDVNGVLVSQCRERGLEVAQADLLQYLSEVKEGSLGALTAFHIVEHLPVEDLLLLLDQTLRALRPGGLLLVETPNPQNVLVGSCNFYFDPTHRHPLPPPVLKFLIESRGFIAGETIKLNPSDDKPLAGDSELVRRFNQYFYGPMDYAIVASKP
jgi:O-antigen chain-terminating methyltransferase